MKNPKNLTVRERTHLESLAIDASKWKISKKTTEKWTIVHVETLDTLDVPAE